MNTEKPKDCTYPDCLNCPLADCFYDEIEQKDITESSEYDREIIHERKKRNAEFKGGNYLYNFNYRNSKKGRESIEKYRKSEKGISCRKKYENSEKGRERYRRYYRRKNPNKKTYAMKVIRVWLDERKKYYTYNEDEHFIKVDRYKIKSIDGEYIVSGKRFATQKDVINDFLICHYGNKYKKIN